MLKTTVPTLTSRFYRIYHVLFLWMVVINIIPSSLAVAEENPVLKGHPHQPRKAEVKTGSCKCNPDFATSKTFICKYYRSKLSIAGSFSTLKT